MTIKEIDAEIQRLRNLRYELERKEIDEFKVAAQENVGRCFDADGVLVKVIGIPQEHSTMTGIDFNKYQYPALYLGHSFHRGKPSIIPFYEDTLFSGAWGVGNNILDRRYEEITTEQFNESFLTRLDRFKDAVTK